MSKESALRFTKEVRKSTEILRESTDLLVKTTEEIKRLDENDTLTIPMLKKYFKECFTNIEQRDKERRNFNVLFSVYEKFIQQKDKGIWEEYFTNEIIFSKRVSDFHSLFEEYKYYSPKNKKELEAKARKLLLAKDFVPDSYFEGDYATWIGVYARPKDKPTYLDANDHEEYLLQEKYSQNGFKQDFSEWFEWEIVNNELVETKD
ncbi:Phi-29-like late activator [Enterococcus wangshanyuanii]|uniref:Phi-29-like late activator n=1 Tax=Enterococcus wangshanyuanii TaxID=2005703 RepID=A0ABQ1PWI0_9ENTE|nr:Phi-29-like late activator [Enterococcus wangshanyuanii]GGD05861.1 hypothetical protein GCM10011573_39110 [Enterococcus wangshanyuanii]